MRTLIVGASPSLQAATIARICSEPFDLIIAADGGWSRLKAAGVSPDVVVGDADSLSATDSDAIADAGIAFERHPTDKDLSDLDLAVDRARRAGATELTVTGVLGGRLDHTLAALGCLRDAADLGPHVVESDCECWVLSPDTRGLVLAGHGVALSVLSLTESAVVDGAGVRWPLDSLRLSSLSSHGISNRIDCGPATIAVRSGVVLVCCHWDDSQAHTVR